MAKYTPGPKPTDLLPEVEVGYHWVPAFSDLETTDKHYTVNFGGKHFKYRLEATMGPREEMIRKGAEGLLSIGYAYHVTRDSKILPSPNTIIVATAVVDAILSDKKYKDFSDVQSVYKIPLDEWGQK